MAYRGVLFDLFGTLIHFDTRGLPEVEIEGQRVRTTLGGLGHVLAAAGVDADVARLWRVLRDVSEELARARTYDLVELPSRERFRRALERLGCDDGRQAEAAARLSRAHMAQIVAATTMPAAHATLLEALRPRWRVGVVSNFDDTAAAYEILVRHGILPRVDTVVVSEAVGLRKPHPALVRLGLAGLGLPADEVLFVGDTFTDDVGAAHAAGMDVAWIDAAGAGVPATGPTPRFVLRSLEEVGPLLGCV